MAGELQYRAGLDISEVYKSRDELLKSFKQLKDAGAAAFSNTKPITNYQQAQLALQKSLADARVEVQRLVQVNQALKNELEQGKIATQNNRAEVEKLKIAEQELKNALLQGKISQHEYTDAINKNKVAQSELNKQVTEAALKDKQAATALKEHALQQKLLAAAAKEAKAANVALSGSYNAAQARLKELGARIKGVQDGFDNQTPAIKRKIKEYNELNQKLKDFDARMGNHQREVGHYSMALKGVGNDLLGLATGFLTAQAALAGLTSIIRTNAQISDSLADVRRTASLTAIEAENLADQLKKIDTRTSLKGLLEIATIGGQVGIAKEQLAGFTKAVDQLAVSLGGELKGGAEGIAKSLGVLDNIFGVTKSNAGDVEKSFNQIGSAILGLGQSGLATGDFLSDFSERVGGGAKQAGLSLPVILSYGAVLQENGVNAEVAGTSFKKLVSLLATKRNDFYTIAKLAEGNLTMQEFTDTINNDTQKALGLFFNGLQKGGTKTTAFMDILQSTGLAMGGVSQTVAALSSNQEALNSHIVDATKDFNDATKSAEQFALKNDNLAASIEKFSNEIGNMVTDGGLSTFFKQGIDGAREFLVYLNKLVNSQSWREFGVRIRGGDASAYDKANSLKLGLEKNSGLAFNNSNDRNLYKQDADALKKSFTDTKDAAIDATVKYNTFKNAIQTGTLKDDGTLKDYKQTADILVQQANNLAKAYEAARDKAFRDRKNKPKEEEVVIPLNEKAAKRIAAQQAKAQETALKRQRTLQAEIDALTRKGVASKLDADQQEIVSVEEKYKKLREKAIAFNNAKDSKGQKVNVSGLNAAETAEKLEITQKTEAKVLAKSLDEQAKYYAEFEDLRTKIGEQKAKERYANLIDVDKTYLEALAKQEEDLLNPGKAKGGSENDADANPFAMKLLSERIEAAKLVQQKADDERYAMALQAAMTHAQALEQIDREYWANRKALGDGASQEQLDNLDRQKADAIRNANETNAYLKGGYDELMQNYDAMTRDQIRKRLQAIKDGYRKEYEEGRITAEQLTALSAPIDEGIAKLDGNNSYKRITTAIKNYREQVAKLGKDSEGAKSAQQEMFAAMAQGAADINEVLGEVAGSLEQLGIGGEGLQDVFKNVQGAVDGIGKIGQGLATGNPVDVVTGSIKLLTSAIDLFNTKDKKLQKQINNYKDQLDSLGKAYNQLDRAVNDSVGESFYTDSQKQIDNLEAQQRLITQMRDAEARKKKSDKGKIAEYNAELDEIPNKIADINKAISENLIQTNFSQLSQNLADALAEAFASGEDSAKAFDDVFSNVINNAVKNSLKMKFLEPIISDFTNELTDYAKKNGNSVIGFDFNRWKDQLKAAGETFTAGLKGSQEFLKDVGLGDNDSDKGNTNSLTGSIKSQLTEETGTVIAGAMNGMLIGINQVATYTLANNNLLTEGNKVAFDAFGIAKSNLEVQMKIEQNTLRTANNTDQLTQIRASLASMDRKTGSGAAALKANGL